jgi:hypothetical protein
MNIETVIQTVGTPAVGCSELLGVVIPDLWLFRAMLFCFGAALYCFIRALLVDAYSINEKPSRKNNESPSEPDKATGGNLSELGSEAIQSRRLGHHFNIGKFKRLPLALFKLGKKLVYIFAKLFGFTHSAATTPNVQSSGTAAERDVEMKV